MGKVLCIHTFMSIYIYGQVYTSHLSQVHTSGGNRGCQGIQEGRSAHGDQGPGSRKRRVRSLWLRFGVQGLGSEVWGLGFKVWGLGFGI